MVVSSTCLITVENLSKRYGERTAVNIFVHHHPKIEWGIHAGSALSIAEHTS